MWKSSNPALTRQDAFSEYYSRDMFAGRAEVTTIAGVVGKTGLLTAVAVAAGAGGYTLAQMVPSLLWFSAIAAALIGIGIWFVIAGRPTLAPVMAPIYALVEGFFLGGVTAVADSIVAGRGLEMMGGVGLQAFIITVGALVSMLALYRLRIIRPTRTLQAVLYTATGAIMIAYLVSFILSFFGMPLPLISFYSAATETGLMGLLGLGINIFILIIASLWLVLDFKLVEENVAAGAPKHMEWYCAFALLVSLAWIYFEAVKLVVRLAVLFGGRD
jgi:uncharacterized YccA/Bax inhibitor family protein